MNPSPDINGQIILLRLERKVNGPQRLAGSMNRPAAPRPPGRGASGERLHLRPAHARPSSISAPGARSRTSASPGSTTTAAIRQGFPEVVFGQGKTPAQIAAIAERIVAAGHSLLVTRTDAPTLTRRSAERARRRISRTGPDHHTPHRRLLRPAAAPSSSRRPAPPTCRSPRKRRSTAEIMGNSGRPDLRRRRRRPPPPARRARTASSPPASSSSSPAWKARCRASSAAWSTCPVIAVPTSVGYGASFGGADGAARHAQQLRERRVGRQHRQRLRRGRDRQLDQPPAAERRGCGARHAGLSV